MTVTGPDHVTWAQTITAIHPAVQSAFHNQTSGFSNSPQRGGSLPTLSLAQGSPHHNRTLLSFACYSSHARSHKSREIPHSSKFSSACRQSAYRASGLHKHTFTGTQGLSMSTRSQERLRSSLPPHRGRVYVCSLAHDRFRACSLLHPRSHRRLRTVAWSRTTRVHGATTRHSAVSLGDGRAVAALWSS